MFSDESKVGLVRYRGPWRFGALKRETLKSSKTSIIIVYVVRRTEISWTPSKSKTTWYGGTVRSAITQPRVVLRDWWGTVPTTQLSKGIEEECILSLQSTQADFGSITNYKNRLLSYYKRIATPAKLLEHFWEYSDIHQRSSHVRGRARKNIIPRVHRP